MKQEEGIQRESDDKTDLIFGADAGHGAVAVPDGPGKGLCDRHFGRTGPELTAPAYVDGNGRTQVPVTIGPSWG